MKCHDTCRNDDAGKLFFHNTPIPEYKERKKLTMRPSAGTSHKVAPPENDNLAQPDYSSVSATFSENLPDLSIGIPTENANDEVQGVDQRIITSGDRPADGISTHDDSSDDTASTNNASRYDAMEEVEASNQKSEPPEDYSEDSASAGDSSADDDDAESTENVTSHDTMQGVQSSEQGSDLHEDCSGNSVSAEDSSPDDDDAEFTHDVTSHGAMEGVQTSEQGTDLHDEYSEVGPSAEESSTGDPGSTDNAYHYLGRPPCRRYLHA